MIFQFNLKTNGVTEMSKLIIDNRSKTSDNRVLILVQRVMDMGRISDNDTAYCACTNFIFTKCTIYASKNKQSDRFLILDR